MVCFELLKTKHKKYIITFVMKNSPDSSWPGGRDDELL